jgi:hypothetical protein
MPELPINSFHLITLNPCRVHKASKLACGKWFETPRREGWLQDRQRIAAKMQALDRRDSLLFQNLVVVHGEH